MKNNFYQVIEKIERMKPLADQDRTMSNVLFLDQSERIEFGYFT